jgi:exopolyphosphatase/pppGpp-phosphohydrolase
MAEKALTAVINCGSHTIRLIVAEYGGEARIQIVDYSHTVYRPGKRRFFHGLHPEKRPCSRPSKSSSSLEKCWQDGISSLQKFRVIGTSAFREAKEPGRLCGPSSRFGQVFRSAVVDGLEENRLTFLAVQHSLGEDL